MVSLRFTQKENKVLNLDYGSGQYLLFAIKTLKSQ